MRWINWLWMCTFTSCVLGRSAVVDFGLMETRAFRNAGLSASASGYRWVRIRYVMIIIYNAYLVVSYDELCDCLKNSTSRELAWSRHSLEVQQLLLSLRRHLASLFGLFLLFHYVPYITGNCMMIDRYVCFIASFLVQFIMLAKVLTAWRVPSLEKGLSLAIFFDEVVVSPELLWVTQFLYSVSQ